MAFSDPIAVTIGGAAKNLVRIDAGRGFSEYLLTEATQEFRMFIRTVELKKEADGRQKWRHTISLRQRIFATPTVAELIRNSQIAIEHYAGDDVTLFDDVALAVAALTTAPNMVKLNNWES